jgi:hypothetical protein
MGTGERDASPTEGSSDQKHRADALPLCVRRSHLKVILFAKKFRLPERSNRKISSHRRGHERSQSATFRTKFLVPLLSVKAKTLGVAGDASMRDPNTVAAIANALRQVHETTSRGSC